jgi:hypothetical protein
MAYIKTNWINDETPLNAENMNKIENQLSILDMYKVPISSPEISVLSLSSVQKTNSYFYGKVDGETVQIPMLDILRPNIKTIDTADTEGINEGDYIFHKEGI